MPRISRKQFITTTFFGDRKIMRKLFTTFILIVIISVFISLTAYAQDDKSVTLVTNGQGKTADDAKQSALRNAIEQAFGTFISSKTDILNDQLIKDEIVSISNGNIQKIEVLSEGKLPDGSYYNTLKATVSVSKLTSFFESKGISVEFKGGLFSFNIKQQKINEENELKAIQDMSVIIKKYIDKSFDFNIDISQPIALNNRQKADEEWVGFDKDGDVISVPDSKLNPLKQQEFWEIPVKVKISANDNFFRIPQILSSTLSGFSLSPNEVQNYKDLKKPTYLILIASDEYKNGQEFFLRNEKSVLLLYDMFYYLKNPILSAKISVESNRGIISNLSIRERILEWKKLIENVDSVYQAYRISGYDFANITKLIGFNLTGDDKTNDNFRLLLNSSILKPFKDRSGGRDHFDNLASIAMQNRINNPLEEYRIDIDEAPAHFNFINVFAKNIPYNCSFVASFLGIKKNDYGLITITYNSIKTLDIVNTITGFKITPGTE
jgi:hypothetical protein